MSEAERQSLIDAGAVGDLMYNFISEDGQIVDHNVNTRAISVGVERLRGAKERVLISGGAEKVQVLLGSIKAVEPNVLITDEYTGMGVLDQG